MISIKYYVCLPSFSFGVYAIDIFTYEDMIYTSRVETQLLRNKENLIMVFNRYLY